MKNIDKDGYNPSLIEEKWRNYWEIKNIFSTDASHNSFKKKYYCLDMFPYPSGSGLHVGHWRGYVVSDVFSRYKYLNNYNVLHPMGWDSFGLPAENDAIKKGIHPKINTEKNITNIKKQLKEIGTIYDWNKEINTSSPEYYKWTQWIFLKMYHEGLAYRKTMPINWCPSCKTGLANEEVINNNCERCGAKIEKKDLNQWMLKITKYADKLLNSLDKLNWPEKVKIMQKNWIGKSEGVEIIFKIVLSDEITYDLSVFTTRPDTLFGATYVVLAPEHELVLKIANKEKREEIERYIQKSKAETDIERINLNKDKTGVFTGSYAINPINNKKIPIWISDYVLKHYGTGAIMCVPAHDQRDFDFAKKFNLPIIKVIKKLHLSKLEDNLTEAYEENGILINSEQFNNMSSEIAKEKITHLLLEKGLAQKSIKYKLRDWIFSRQRYWGEPIPIIYCKKCGEVPVSEKDLPVLLPDIKKYEPSGTGKSPLATIDEWVNTTCHVCNGPAKRETDTMPQWAGSSWYYLRYPSTHINNEPFNRNLTNNWLPVDTYIGGIEHAILHLLYARFFTKFLYDINFIDFDEPFLNLFNQGMIYRNGAKMSKSKGNVVSPDELVKKYGTDSLRLYELFIGPPEIDSEWNDTGIIGMFKFLQKIWKYQVNNITVTNKSDKQIDVKLNVLINDISERIDKFKLNTAISKFMEFINYLNKENLIIDLENWKKFLILLSPFTPHICEELWFLLGNKNSIFEETWPAYDPNLISKSDIVNLAVQINGKLRGIIMVQEHSNENQIKDLIMNNEKFQNFFINKHIIKTIYVKNRLINIVIKLII